MIPPIYNPITYIEWTHTTKKKTTTKKNLMCAFFIHNIYKYIPHNNEIAIAKKINLVLKKK